ncbi:hypothetical protein RJ639_005631 [Escallonia herrerae]|uniref:Pentatricopeptide repeat-containing protein n=1 Tax=Escallonia herrerae TaxID=1293975 RepID=A0AA89ASN5_9ASTE|nr:hypothetical protein RJ639_005631 [Escallonia herrerae]
MRHILPLHAQIILHGLTHETLTLGKLISFCAVSSCGDLRYAHQVFDEISEPNRYMYNSLIRGYSTSNDPARAFCIYRSMTSCGICPNEFTFPFVFKACVSKSAYLEGVSVHVQVIKLGFGCQVVVQNALVGFYFGCGSIGCARKVFNEIADRTLVSWNSMISAYSKTGGYEDAFLLFWEMRGLGVEPDDFTFVSLLSVRSQKCDVKLGSLLHSYIQVTGIKVDTYVQNALLDMYASFGHLHTAQAVFDRMTEKNVVSWTSMVTAYAKSGLIEPAKKLIDQTPLKNVVCWNSRIACYIQEGCFKEAMDLFRDMCNSTLVPDEITLVSVLSACCQLDDMDMGKNIHDYISSNIMTPSISLCNALIDMYAKCGSVESALGVFMIGALALHRCGSKAVELFENLEAGRVCPDQITFTGLLSACCHSGLVDGIHSTSRAHFRILAKFSALLWISWTLVENGTVIVKAAGISREL